MTKKDFELIADVIASANTGKCGEDVAYGIAKDFAARLALDNPHFDAERFLIACGFE